MAAIPKAYTNGIPQAIPQAPDTNQAFSSVPQIPQAGGVPVPSASAPSMQTPQVGVSQVPDYQNWDASAQFKLFQTAPDIGNQEMQRAVNQRNIYQASGDTPKMAAANDWIGKVGTVMSGVPKTPTPSPYTDQYRQATNDYNDTYNQLKTQMKTPFAYNPQTDPQAQAYKGYYDNLANESSHNAMEAMNSRGLLNSSMTAGEVAKAQNDAQLQYGTKIADLGNQAYQRYQDQIGNQSRLLGLVGQSQDRAMQGLQNDRSYGLQQGEFGLKQNAEARAAQGQAFDQSYKTNDQNFNQMAKTSELTGRYDPTAGVRQQMDANSAAWNGASPEEQQRLHAANIRLAQSIGGAYNEQTGEYNLPQPQMTLQGQQLNAQLTGRLQNGELTYGAQQDQFKNALESSSVTGYTPSGQNTLARDQLNQTGTYQQGTLGVQQGQLGVAQGQLGVAKDKMAWEKDPKNPQNIYTLDRGQYYANGGSKGAGTAATADNFVKSLRANPMLFKNEVDDSGSTPRNTGRKIPADAAQIEGILQNSGLSEPELKKAYQQVFTPEQIKQIPGAEEWIKSGN